MPTLLRFVLIVGSLAGLSFGGLYALATYFEPPQQEVSKPVPGVKVKRP